MFYRTFAGARVRPQGVAVLAALLATALLGKAPPVSAHEGHEHGPPTVSLPTNTVPRAAATGDAFEAVAVLVGEGLRVTIDRYADNAPVTSAVVTAIACCIPKQRELATSVSVGPTP